MQKTTLKRFQEDMETESQRISQWLNKFESPSSACEYFISEVLFNLDANYYEILGLLEEIKLRYRDIIINARSEGEP